MSAATPGMHRNLPAKSEGYSVLIQFLDPGRQPSFHVNQNIIDSESVQVLNLEAILFSSVLEGTGNIM